MIPTFNVAGTGLFGGHRRVVTDPFRDNVVVLLEGEGANGGTTIVDSGPHGLAITMTTSYTTSTVQAKQGSSSILTNAGGGEMFYTNTAQTLLPANWTIEQWIWSISGQMYIWFMGTNPTPIMYLFRGGDTVPKFQSPGTTRITGSANSTGAWHHYVVQNVSGTIEFGVDGVSAGTWVGSPSMPGVGEKIRIGCAPSGQEGVFYIDEFRISNIARYTFPFTPPTAPLY
jgi:hypothetical protein